MIRAVRKKVGKVWVIYLYKDGNLVNWTLAKAV